MCSSDLGRNENHALKDKIGNSDNLKGDKTFVQAGAGVVADSDPEYEYNETLNKAMGLIKAIEFAASLED